MSSTKSFWISCGLSLTLFLITCWSAIYTDTTPYWIESIGYFILTYFCLKFVQAKNNKIATWYIISAIILGRIILEIPMRILDWNGCVGSFMIIISCIIAILLAAYCYNSKKITAFVLSYVILALFNSVVADYWSKFLLNQ